MAGACSLCLTFPPNRSRMFPGFREAPRATHNPVGPGSLASETMKTMKVSKLLTAATLAASISLLTTGCRHTTLDPLAINGTFPRPTNPKTPGPISDPNNRGISDDRGITSTPYKEDGNVRLGKGHDGW